MYEKILVGYLDTEQGRDALELGRVLAQANHAEMLVVTARALPVFLRGNPAGELIRATEAGVDMLVLGSRPGGPLLRALHSSISNAVMAEASCPVLIRPVRARAPQASLA